MAEIDAAIQEEREARKGLGLKEAFFGKGNFIRFVIAFMIFLLQQWAGQNSVKYDFSDFWFNFLIDTLNSYYAPQIFESVRYFLSFMTFLVSPYPSDWIYRNEAIVARQWHLRYCDFSEFIRPMLILFTRYRQGSRYLNLHLLRGGNSWS